MSIFQLQHSGDIFDPSQALLSAPPSVPDLEVERQHDEPEVDHYHCKKGREGKKMRRRKAKKLAAVVLLHQISISRFPDHNHDLHALCFVRDTVKILLYRDRLKLVHQVW